MPCQTEGRVVLRRRWDRRLSALIRAGDRPQAAQGMLLIVIASRGRMACQIWYVGWSMPRRTLANAWSRLLLNRMC